MKAKYGDVICHNNTGQIFLVMEKGELVRLAGGVGTDSRWDERSRTDTSFTVDRINNYAVIFNFIDTLRKGLGE